MIIFFALIADDDDTAYTNHCKLLMYYLIEYVNDLHMLNFARYPHYNQEDPVHLENDFRLR